MWLIPLDPAVASNLVLLCGEGSGVQAPNHLVGRYVEYLLPFDYTDSINANGQRGWQQRRQPLNPPRHLFEMSLERSVRWGIGNLLC